MTSPLTERGAKQLSGTKRNVEPSSSVGLTANEPASLCLYLPELGFWTASITNGFLCKNQGQSQVLMLERQALYQPSHRLSAP